MDATISRNPALPRKVLHCLIIIALISILVLQQHANIIFNKNDKINYNRNNSNILHKLYKKIVPVNQGLGYNIDDHIKANTSTNQGLIYNVTDYKKASTSTEKGLRYNITDVKTTTFANQRLRYHITDDNISVEAYNVSVSPDVSAPCMIMKNIQPHTHICTYQQSDDIYISRSILGGGAWEGNILRRIQREMKKDKHLGLIDLGANIGVYSLVVANMGHKVVAAEPSSKTIQLFAKSIRMGNLTEKITVLKYGISNKRDAGTLKLVGLNNQGSKAVQPKVQNCSSCETIKLIYMDDIVPFITFNKAIIKIDIEQHEYCAFQNISKLFDKVHIPYIFMEWLIVGERSMNSEKSRLISFLSEKGYIATYLDSALNDVPVSPNLHWTKWPGDITWVYKNTSQHQT